MCTRRKGWFEWNSPASGTDYSSLEHALENADVKIGRYGVISKSPSDVLRSEKVAEQLEEWPE